MHDNIITQNIKLIDTKMIINEVKFEISDDTKYLLYYVTREFEPKICERCGFNNFAIYRARILYISSVTGCQSSCTKLCPRLMGFVIII